MDGPERVEICFPRRQDGRPGYGEGVYATRCHRFLIFESAIAGATGWRVIADDCDEQGNPIVAGPISAWIASTPLPQVLYPTRRAAIGALAHALMLCPLGLT